MPSVREVMTTDLINVAPSATVMEAAGVMYSRRAGSTLVMQGDELLGIFTERDVLRALAQHSDGGRSSPVSEWMTPDPVSIAPDASVGQALDMMLDGGFRHLPVVHNQIVEGVVSMRDLSRSLANRRT